MIIVFHNNIEFSNHIKSIFHSVSMHFDLSKFHCIRFLLLYLFLFRAQYDLLSRLTTKKNSCRYFSAVLYRRRLLISDRECESVIECSRTPTHTFTHSGTVYTSSYIRTVDDSIGMGGLKEGFLKQRWWAKPISILGWFCFIVSDKHSLLRIEPFINGRRYSRYYLHYKRTRGLRSDGRIVIVFGYEQM